MKQRSRLAVFAAVVAMAGCNFPGQRALHVRVEHNGRVVAEGLYSVPDSYNRQATWARLSEASLEGVGPITPDANDPKLAVLNGTIRVSLEHAGRPYAAANVTQLRLVADPARAGRWLVEPADVARMGRTLK